MRVAKLLFLICCCALCGCEAVEFLTPEGPPYNEEIGRSYYQTELKTSGSADVLATIHLQEYEKRLFVRINDCFSQRGFYIP